LVIEAKINQIQGTSDAVKFLGGKLPAYNEGSYLWQRNYAR
jgi:hypothetical protein